MKYRYWMLVGAALLATSCGNAGKSSLDKTLKEGKPLVRVGDEKIHEGYLNLLQKVNPGLKEQLETPFGKRRIVDNLIEQELLYQESIDRGLNKKPQVQEKIALFERAVIAQSLLDEEIEKKAKEYYERNKESEFERVKVAHIFFSNMPKLAPPTPDPKNPKANLNPPSPTEADKKKSDEEAKAKAQKAYDRLKKGEEWDVVVKELSEDKGSANRGGEFGYLTRGDRRVERLEYQDLVKAAFSLKKGEYSEPIKTREGWRIIKVVEEKQAQPYEEVALQVKFRVRGEVRAALMDEIRKKRKVQYLDTSLDDSQIKNSAGQPPLQQLPANAVPLKNPPSSPTATIQPEKKK